MDVTRALGTLLGLLIFFGIPSLAFADSTKPKFDVRTSRSTYLYLTDPTKIPAERVKMRDRRIRLRYEQAVEVGGSDFVLRFKAPLKKKRLLAVEVLF